MWELMAIVALVGAVFGGLYLLRHLSDVPPLSNIEDPGPTELDIWKS